MFVKQCLNLKNFHPVYIQEWRGEGLEYLQQKIFRNRAEASVPEKIFEERKSLSFLIFNSTATFWVSSLYISMNE
jgi:hypothetical protein